MDGVELTNMRRDGGGNASFRYLSTFHMGQSLEYVATVAEFHILIRAWSGEMCFILCNIQSCTLILEPMYRSDAYSFVDLNSVLICQVVIA